jgi:hypothetical protein
MSFMDFSSWPREQEQSFVVFEQRQSESQKKAFTIAGVVAAAVLFLALGVYAGVEPEHKDVTKGMNMSNITKKSKQEPKAEAPAEQKQEAPAPAPSGDKAAAPAEKPAAPADKPAAPADQKK